MKIIGIYCDKDWNVTVFKDGFQSEDEAKQYMKQNNLDPCDYFVETVEV